MTILIFNLTIITTKMDTENFKNLNCINVKWVSENSQGAKRLTASDSTVGF